MSSPEVLRLEDPEAIISSKTLLATDLPLFSLPTRVAFIGNYLPRRCGIATFTTDLCTAMSAEYGSERSLRNSGQRSGLKL